MHSILNMHDGASVLALLWAKQLLQVLQKGDALPAARHWHFEELLPRFILSAFRTLKPQKAISYLSCVQMALLPGSQVLQQTSSLIGDGSQSTLIQPAVYVRAGLASKVCLLLARLRNSIHLQLVEGLTCPHKVVLSH